MHVVGSGPFAHTKHGIRRQMENIIESAHGRYIGIRWPSRIIFLK